MESPIEIIYFIRGVLLDTDAGPLIIILALFYLGMKIKDIKHKKQVKNLQTHATIQGRHIFRGSGITFKLTTSNGWKAGIFLGANEDGYLIIKTETDAKIAVDPNYISDIRVYDPH